jgi:HK97 family phage major capsid protein
MAYTPMASSDANQTFLPEAAAELIVRPVEAASLAVTVSTVVRTAAHKLRVPIVTDDPTAAWTAEGAPITESNPTLGEEVIAFSKVAGLTVVSRELANDSSPAAAQIVGDGLARDIARQIDAAYFANTTANAPDGLESLTTSQVTTAAASWTLDTFTEAIFKAEAEGVTPDAFCFNPADAETLSKLKTATGSNVPLLQPDPTRPGRRQIAGIPMRVSTAVAAGVAWAIPTSRVIVAIRDDVTLDVDTSAYFKTDQVAVRATMRVGFGYPHPLAIVRIGAVT